MAGIAAKVALGIGVSLLVMIVYSLFLDVDFSDILKIGGLGFGLAALAHLTRLLSQGIRFYFLANISGGGRRVGLRGSVLARLAGEFVALVSPAYFGGEALRVAWLRSKGVNVGRAAWTSFTELFLDVVAGSSVSIVVGLYALSSGAIAAGSLILAVATPALAFFLALSWASAKRRIAIPGLGLRLMEKVFGKHRADSINRSVDSAGARYSEAAQEFFSLTPKVRLIGAAFLTGSLMILGGLTLWIISQFMGLELSILWAVAGVTVALTIGSIPVSPGGAGLMELGLSLIASIAAGPATLGAVVAWRIVYYYGGLVITGAALGLLLIRTPEIYSKSLGKPDTK